MDEQHKEQEGNEETKEPSESEPINDNNEKLSEPIIGKDSDDENVGKEFLYERKEKSQDRDDAIDKDKDKNNTTDNGLSEQNKSMAKNNGQHDDMDTTKTNSHQEKVEDHTSDLHQLSQSINPIDLVLMELEISEQTSHDQGDHGDDHEGKKLTFSVEEGKDVSKEDTEQSDSCCNPEFRYKVIDTIFLFWNTTTMGWVYGQMGPALPDLQFLVGASLQEATWVFTGFAIGYLGGCLLAGLIQDKFNPRLMLFLYTLGTAITITVLPWLPVLPAMVAIRVVNGICIGGQDTGLHSMLFAIWARDGGPFVQMTHVLNALGGILSPLVTQPFVSEATDEAVHDESTKINTTMYNATTWNTTSNITESSNITATHLSTTSRTTNIHYAFLITGILVLTAAVPFLVAFLQKRRIIMAKRQYSNESVDKNKLPANIKRFILVVLCVNSFVATAYIDLFPSFLTTFVMEQISWSQKSASAITSVFFAMYAVGNFIGVFILPYLTPTKLIVFSYISSAIMILGVLLSVMFNQTELIWVTVALAGLTMSGILPTLFTWTQENVMPITARLASLLLITGSAGVMANPLLLGYMMEELSPMWFIYLSLGETVLCAILFAAAFILSRMYTAHKPSRSRESTRSREMTALNKDATQDEEIKRSESKTEIYPRGTLYGI